MSTDRKVSSSPPKSIGITLQRIFMGAHVSLYRLTGGGIGGKMGADRAALLLATTGRKNGKSESRPFFI